MNELKVYFRNLHSQLLKSSEFERNLSRKTKQMTQEIVNQRSELDRIGTKQFADYTTLGELKREHLKVSATIFFINTWNMKIERE